MKPTPFSLWLRGRTTFMIWELERCGPAAELHTRAAELTDSCPGLSVVVLPQGEHPTRPESRCHGGEDGTR